MLYDIVLVEYVALCIICDILANIDDTPSVV